MPLNGFGLDRSAHGTVCGSLSVCESHTHCGHDYLRHVMAQLSFSLIGNTKGLL